MKLLVALLAVLVFASAAEAKPLGLGPAKRAMDRYAERVANSPRIQRTVDPKAEATWHWAGACYHWSGRSVACSYAVDGVVPGERGFACNGSGEVIRLRSGRLRVIPDFGWDCWRIESYEPGEVLVDPPDGDPYTYEP